MRSLRKMNMRTPSVVGRASEQYRLVATRQINPDAVRTNCESYQARILAALPGTSTDADQAATDYFNLLARLYARHAGVADRVAYQLWPEMAAGALRFEQQLRETEGAEPYLERLRVAFNSARLAPILSADDEPSTTVAVLAA
jgi:hypothetical protein